MERERRTDLEMLEADFNTEYIGEYLIPTIVTEEDAGKIFFTEVSTAGSVTSDRATGVALVSNNKSASSLDYTLTRKEYRADVEFKEDEQHGRAFTDQMGSRTVKKTMQRQEEQEAANAILGNATRVDILADHGGSIIEAVRVGLENLEEIAGKAVFVCSKKDYQKMSVDPEILEHLKSTGVIAKDEKIVRGIQPEVVAAVLGVDEIKIGKTSIWQGAAAAYADRAALIKVPPAGVTLADLKLDPYCMVRLQQDVGEGDSAWQIFYHANATDKKHYFDGEARNKIQTFNSAGLITFEKLVATV